MAPVERATRTQKTNSACMERLDQLVVQPATRAKGFVSDHVMRNLGLSKQVALGRRQVMQCSLELMAFVWIAVFGFAVVAKFVLFPVYFEDKEIEFYTWILFAHIATTISWAVLSRAVSGGVRRGLFVAWVATLILTVSWFVMQAEYTMFVIVFMTVVVAGLFSAAAVSTSVDFNAPVAAFLKYGTVVAAAAGVVVLGVNRIDYFSGRAVTDAVLLALLYVLVQVVATWTYLHRNSKVWLVDNTCIFASMSPWSEAVDLFAVFSGKQC